MKPLNLLAIAGSLRARSSNAALLQAAAMLAPDDVSVEIYQNLGDLPHFDSGAVPRLARELRARVRAADGVIISTPEYAHGLPANFKNLLDWLVDGGEWWDKPVLVLRTGYSGELAHALLIEALNTLMANVTIRQVPLGTGKITAETLAQDNEMASLLRVAVAALASEI